MLNDVFFRALALTFKFFRDSITITFEYLWLYSKNHSEQGEFKSQMWSLGIPDVRWKFSLVGARLQIQRRAFSVTRVLPTFLPRHSFAILFMPHVRACARNMRYRNLFAERIVALLVCFVRWHNAIFASSFRSRRSRGGKKGENSKTADASIHMASVLLDGPRDWKFRFAIHRSLSSSSPRFVDSKPGRNRMQVSPRLIVIVLMRLSCINGDVI